MTKKIFIMLFALSLGVAGYGEGKKLAAQENQKDEVVKKTDERWWEQAGDPASEYWWINIDDTSE